MLRTKIKASAVTNLTDARYFAAREVHWLGFSLDPGSDRHVQPQLVNAIREWVDGPLITGEFNLQTAGEIRTAIDLLRLDAVQAGMFTSADTLIELASPVPVIKEIVVDSGATEDDIRRQIEAFAALAGAFLLDFAKNGISWEQLRRGRGPLPLPALKTLCAQFPLLLALDIPPPQLEDLLDALPLHGLAVQGGEEEKVGVKSFDELDELFDALES